MDEPPARGVASRMPLRLRFALLSTAIVAIAETVVFLLVLLYQGQFVRGRFDDRLRRGLESVASEISEDDLAMADGLGGLAEVTFDDLLYRDRSLAVFSTDGELLASDVPRIAGDLAAQVTPRISKLGAEVEIIDGRLEQGRPGHSPRYRIAMRRLGFGDYAVAAFASTDHIDRTVRTTAAAFAIALPITLVVIGGATWYVAGLVIRPIEELRGIARRLGPDSIPESVDLGPAPPEVQRLESELAAAMARIEAGYETQSRFMTNVAHELKTPISVVLAQGQTLTRGGVENDETRAFVESTVEEMQRLGRMIESFLTLTRVREGTAAHPREELLVNELLMDSVEHCLQMARTHDVDLVPSLIATDRPAVVNGDADLLRTAIDNLIRNAIRFSPAGDRIEVTGEEAGDDWAVVVRDHGPGIPPELIDRIFDRFAQVKSEQRLGRGSGLGLEIAQGIAELHGGGVTATNEALGCRFTLRLPKARSRSHG